MLTIHTILHPTDFSEASKHALSLACSLARDHGAKLFLLTVQPLPLPHPDRDSSQGLTAEQDSRKQLAELADTIVDIPVMSRVICGDPASTIVATAEEEHVDVIVMGTRGLSVVPRELFGSVAEQVIRNATCPVVTIKPPKPQPFEKGEQLSPDDSEIAEFTPIL